MFEMNERKKELIIVCDDKCTQYANYIMQLLGRNDDEGDNIVGVKDGTVTAAIYTEKQYNDSKSKITSNTHVLFIGDNPTTKEQSKFITLKFNQFGMCFGWQGKRAVMYVDRTFNSCVAYNSFYNYAVNYQDNLNKVIDRESIKKPAAGTMIDVDPKHEKLFFKLPKLLAIVPPVGIAVAAKESISSMKERKAIKDQQYRCLTMVTYLEWLSKFLED